MMSKPHPLAEEIKKWANDPDKWQWRLLNASGTWRNCTVGEATNHAEVMGPEYVQLISKRNRIPAHLLPEGWEVERNPAGTYYVKSPKFWGYVESERATHNDAPSVALHQLLRHIDSEAKS